jgi:hypothetical protein
MPKYKSGDNWIMPKYKSGDIVRIQRHPSDKVWASPDMDNYDGKIFAIKSFYSLYEGTELYLLIGTDAISYYRWDVVSLLPNIWHENQFCNECKISCPHTEPNISDHQYICVSCQTLKDLSNG